MPSPPAQAAALQAYGLSEQLWGMQPTRIDAAEFIRTIAESFDECMKQEREACAEFVENTYRNAEDEALRARFVVPEAKDGYLEAWHQASDVAAAIRNRIDLTK